MNTANNFSAGVGKTNITPPLGSGINGDFVLHYATSIHDDLYAKSLFLKNDETSLLMIVVDICSMDIEFVDQVKSLITEKINIDSQNILISSTHTHAAGSIAEVHLSPMDVGYRKSLAPKIAESAIIAYSNLEPATVASGRIDVPDHVLCRRYKMKEEYQPINPVSHTTDAIKTNPIGIEEYIIEPIAETDPELSYLAINNLKGECISIYANYSLHYVGDWENGTISADYYGYFAQYLENHLNTADQFVAMMSNGTSGDINIWDFQGLKNHPTGLFEKSILIGEDLASKLIDSMSSLEWESSPKLRSQTTEATFGLRKPSLEELTEAEKIIAVSDYETYNYDDANLRKLYAREQSMLYQFPDTRTSIFQLHQIGKTLIGTLPGEYFAETGLWLKKQCSNMHYFTVGIANDNIGYVPPMHELEKGGYETWRCRYSCMEASAEEETRKIMTTLIENFT